jgi:hypothetical protein
VGRYALRLEKGYNGFVSRVAETDEGDCEGDERREELARSEV